MVQRKTILFGIIAIGIAAVCVIAVLKSRRTTPDAISSTAPQSTPSGTPRTPLQAQQNRSTSDVVALPIALRVNGFSPNEITRPAGDFLFAVTNLTGLPDLDLVLAREKGGPLHDGKVTRQKPAWRENVRLPAGNYQLTVKNHPEWAACRITITSH